MPIQPNPDPWLPESPVPVDREATSITVLIARLGSLENLEPLSGIACEYVERHAGTDPGVAGFRYRFAGDSPDSPQSAEEALDINYGLDDAVKPGDRLVVKATRWDGGYDYLFDGLVLDFQLELSAERERVNFYAQGIAKRLWDTPIPGMLMRNCDSPDDAEDNDVQTSLVAQFNPKGKPNRTPDDAEADAGGGRLYHTFLDAGFVQKPDVRKFWTLADAARYLLLTMNADEHYVQNPDLDSLDALLVSRKPIDGVTYDPDDPETYEARDVIATDRPITGRDWPSMLHTLVRDIGVDMEFLTYANADGTPETHLRLFLQQSARPKTLYLQPRFAALDPSYSNTARLDIGRDFRSVANVWTAEGRQVRYEASFILAPGYPASADDASASNLVKFDRAAIKADPSNADKYRLYVLDECGEGHYAPSGSTKIETPFDFDSLLGKDKWVKRRRKPLAELLSKGPDGKPLKAALSYAHEYAGSVPGYWDGTGDWKPITGGWELLDDRIGIRINNEHPNNWSVGKDPESGVNVELRGVEGPALNNLGLFRLRLTVVIEADEVVKGEAKRRPECPLSDEIRRVIDARDRYQKNVIDLTSEFNSELVQIVERDDTQKAEADALGYRISADAGVLQGVAAVPYITTYYGIGDRVTGLAGRGLGFRTDGGGSDSQKVYPVVEGIRWEFGGAQRTLLYLSDEAQQRHLVERKLAR